MKPILIQEPELEFGAHKHIDIRYGIMNYSPLDYKAATAPKRINIGVIGTPQTIEALILWLDRCRNEVGSKESDFYNLYPKFPGFNLETAFLATLVLDHRLQAVIPDRTIDILSKNDNFNSMVSEAVSLVIQELEHLAERRPNVVICAMPKSLHEAIEANRSPVGKFKQKSDEVKFDFHDMLKAASMRFRVPIQLVWPPTYDPTKQLKAKRIQSVSRRLQDDATRAWNFHTALYYKANGVPWRIPRKSNDLEACYVGISLYKSLLSNQLSTSMAQVFNERGEGIIVRGGIAKVSKEDRQVHLEVDDAYNLLNEALEQYRREHKHLPARVVVHKSSSFDGAELDGFNRAVEFQRVEFADFVHATRTFTRLFRNGMHAPLRGTFLSLDRKNNILYTRGTVNFYQVYPGLHVPRPLIFDCVQTEQTPLFIAEEILTLTKMNWNNTQLDGSEPMTLTAARKVGSILKYISNGREVVSDFRYYM